MRHPYTDLLHGVAKPSRYLGGESLSVVKDPATVDARICLAFPDAYEIGMSHLGTKILYSVLNKHPKIACERAFAPWTDMEKALREAGLPLLSLESATPLAEFDVIGCSLQYELTYTNVLTILDLAGLPLLASERTDAMPLILGGGPTATHPEPVAPFFDAFYIGEGEEELPELLLAWAAGRRAGRPRRELLVELAQRFPLYVPALYDTIVDETTGCEVIAGPNTPGVPARIRRAVVEDLDKYPFPSDSPVPYAEAIFDRASIEIARGCTEGCRFCQAGMIYRPVRERSPDSIIESLEGTLKSAGHDEASLTCLSTADYSAITPLVQGVMAKLRGRKVSLAVSSLRAYGLSEDLLDELASVRATGLTFAPEAGTQRMRDVINKNVTEAHIAESAERVFAKGWHRLKLYFMIGNPTEEAEDVRGIVETGARMLRIGKTKTNMAEVTVSVSSHVPKPHTPFQWCRMDSMEEIAEKQALLRKTAAETHPKVKLKTHDRGGSWVEGVMSRGDRRVAAAILHAWKAGARFDGWEELFDLGRWRAAFAATGVEPERYLGTFPVDGRLSWDHIDVGLADGFLAFEYRRALKNRLSHPCGKPYKTLLHHTNVADAQADQRKLVCYDCGIACDLTQMREERVEYLVQLGAHAPAPPRPPREKEPVRIKGRSSPRHELVQGEGTWYRLRYTKLGRSAWIGHLDVNRLVIRLLRRAEMPMIYSLGFHPKPQLIFAPALGLGVPALAELVDVKLDVEPDVADLLERLNEHAPEGVRFLEARRLAKGAPILSSVVHAAEVAFDAAGHDPLALTTRARALLAAEVVPFDRGGERGQVRRLDARPYLDTLDVLEADGAARLRAAIGWGGADPLVLARVKTGPDGSVRPRELAGLLGLGDPDCARVGLVGLGDKGAPFDPLDPPVRAISRPPSAEVMIAPNG